MNSADLQLSADTVKRLRRERGMTQEQLAAVAGLSSQAIVSNVERGLTPGPEVARRLREVLMPAQSGALEGAGTDA